MILLSGAKGSDEPGVARRHLGPRRPARHVCAAGSHIDPMKIKADPLDIDADDAILAGSLRWAHRDPFDRMLVAQAIRHNLPVVTSDSVIIDAGVVPTINSRG